MPKEKAIRYEVTGTKKLETHSYSPELGDEALQFAIDCADHPSMEGEVYAVCEDESRERVYSSKAFWEQNHS